MASARGAVLITGASSGIGEACALRLSGHGFGVFAGVRKESDGAALQQKSAAIVPVLIDVTNGASITGQPLLSQPPSAKQAWRAS